MLEIKELTGGYVNIPVLKDVSFEVGNGQLVGLIGLNGAGKSTTINEIIGLLTPYKGQIQIDGLELRTNPSDYRKKIGFIPETPSLYEELTLREHIETVAMAYDIEQETAFKRVDKLLEMFRLKEKLDWFPAGGDDDPRQPGAGGPPLAGQEGPQEGDEQAQGGALLLRSKSVV